MAASLIAMGAVATVTVAEPTLDDLCSPGGALGAWPLLALPLHLEAAQELRPDLYGRQIIPVPDADAELATRCTELGAYTGWFYHQLARQLDLTGGCEGFEQADCTAVLTCTENQCGLRLADCDEECPTIAGCTGGACRMMAASAQECSTTIDADAKSLRSQSLAPPDDEECQEYCSTTNTSTRDDYRNGDCACDTFPRSPTDLDGDGALNEFDSDDDCDHLSDELEEGIGWLQPATENNPFLMVPSGAPAQATMHFDSLAWGTDKWEDLGEGDAGFYTPEGTQYPDPYLKMESSFASQSVLTESMPSAFTKTNHPWNVGSAGYAWDKGVNGYSAAQAAMPSMPNNYDSTSYKLRDSAAGTPRIAVAFELWEDDAGSSDRGGDDLIFSLDRLDYLTEYASTDVRTNKLGSTPYKIAHRGLADVDVTISTNISSCAIQWAGMVMGGSYVVDSSQVAGYLQCAD